MNEILQLKGFLQSSKGNGSGGFHNIPKGRSISIEHLKKLLSDLKAVYEYWENDKLLNKKLISIYYNQIVAKTNRIHSFFKHSIDSVVGAKFTYGDKLKHIITHCIELLEIKEAINILEQIVNSFTIKKWLTLSWQDLKNIHDDKQTSSILNIKKNKFLGMIVDAYYIEKFGIETTEMNFSDNSIITIYDTGIPTEQLFNRIGINYLKPKTIDDTTLLLTPDQYSVLKSKAPFLIAMAVRDINLLNTEDDLMDNNSVRTIQKPTNEPTIGVIDTPFDENVYFHEWVSYKHKLDKSIPINDCDYDHGTKVSSIIVDGDALNPQLNDECGKFKVRHFGVAAGKSFSSFTILRSIQEIVAANRDIKVWNLSLGSMIEINNNFISPEAAILDRIQSSNDVVFIIAGTNKGRNDKEAKRIGIPADSINSLVVNSVGFDKKPAPYSRKGPVLSFFTKPDISYYGGVTGQEIKTYAPFGESLVTGTSFAAPWIARKMAFLIHIMGFPREVAKALLLDSATGWEKPQNSSFLVGHGVVPIKMSDILKSNNNEIKFIISGISEKYDTYNYNIPVPVSNIKGEKRFPYIAKATMCYFPDCSRNQGVDYTNTELDLHFGPIKKRKEKKYIDSVNDNKQSEEIEIIIHEEEARKLFRKWDNVKFVSDYYSTRKRAKRKCEDNGWGFSIKAKERLGKKTKTPFGLVITLRNLQNDNRIDEFIQLCSLNNWLVTKINIENRINIYNQADVNINFEEE